jgi:2-hydroxychromene-2-carboxylate isomerase
VTVADRLGRRVLPRAVVLQSRVTWPARSAAAARRMLGRKGTVELYFAFDDPSSAVALIELAERTKARDVELQLRPVVRRGIPDDPAVERKRRYAIADSRRLGARFGLALSRTEPLDPDGVSVLAEWVSATPQSPALVDFCADAMRQIWLTGEGPVPVAEIAALWRRRLGQDPPPARPAPVRRNEQAMRRRGPYDTPAAWVHGRWFFAHERIPQIEHWLDELGWGASA